jgi:hypothetical protein
VPNLAPGILVALGEGIFFHLQIVFRAQRRTGVVGHPHVTSAGPEQVGGPHFGLYAFQADRLFDAQVRLADLGQDQLVDVRGSRLRADLPVMVTFFDLRTDPKGFAGVFVAGRDGLLF